MTINRRHTIASAVALFLAPVAGSALAAANPLGSPPPMEVFGRFDAVDFIALSPSGNRVAMVMRTGDDRVLIDFDLTTQKALNKPLGKVKVRSIQWADDERIVVTVSQTAVVESFSGQPREYGTVIVLDMARNKSFVLFATDPDYHPVVASGVGVVTVGGKKYITAAGIKRQGGVQLLSRFDPATGRASPIDQGSGYTQSWILAGDGTPVIRKEFRQDNLKHSVLINAGTGWKEAYVETSGLQNIEVWGIGRDGKSAIVTFESGDRANRLFQMAQDGGLTGPLERPHIKGNVYPLFDPTTRLHNGFGYRDFGADEAHHEYFDPADQKRYDAVKKAMGDYRASSVETADDKDKRIVFSEGFDDSGTYFFMNLATGKASTIGRQRPDLSPEWTAETQGLRYKAADGLEIHGYITFPPGRDAKNLPMIVMPHGGPQSHDTIECDWMTQAFASRGYAVFRPNFRGSDGYGQAFIEAGYGEWGKKMQTDLSDGARYLVSQGIADAKRISIFGWSYGGYAALAAATFDPAVYRCSAAGAPVSDLNAMMTWVGQQSGTQRSGAFAYWKRYMAEDKGGLAAVSPALHADKVNMPLLLIHGTDDTTVPINQSERMVAAMKAAGKPVEYVTLLREDHWLTSSEKNRTDMLKAVVAFMETHNPAY